MYFQIPHLSDILLKMNVDSFVLKHNNDGATTYNAFYNTKISKLDFEFSEDIPANLTVGNNIKVLALSGVKTISDIPHFTSDCVYWFFLNSNLGNIESFTVYFTAPPKGLNFVEFAKILEKMTRLNHLSIYRESYHGVTGLGELITLTKISKLSLHGPLPLDTDFCEKLGFSTTLRTFEIFSKIKGAERFCIFPHQTTLRDIHSGMSTGSGFTGPGYTSKHFHAFFKALENNSSITDLSCNVALDNQNATNLQNFIVKNTSLTSLRFIGNFHENSLCILCEALLKSKSIKNVFISDLIQSGISDELSGLLYHLIKKNTLQSFTFDVYETYLNMACTTKIFTELASNNCLKELKWRSPVDITEAKILGESLSKNSTLEILQVGCYSTDISSESVSLIKEGIRKNNTLKDITLTSPDARVDVLWEFLPKNVLEHIFTGYNSTPKVTLSDFAPVFGIHLQNRLVQLMI